MKNLYSIFLNKNIDIRYQNVVFGICTLNVLYLFCFIFFFIDIQACRSFKQNEQKEKVSKLKYQICNLSSLQTNGGLELVSKEDVDKIRTKLKKEEAYLTRLTQGRRHQQIFRDKKKKLIQKVCDGDENAARILKPVNREQAGHPRIEEDFPQLHSTMLDIVDASSAAHDRRREPILRTTRTTSDLTDELNNQGITISRSATYLRLIPR